MEFKFVDIFIKNYFSNNLFSNLKQLSLYLEITQDNIPNGKKSMSNGKISRQIILLLYKFLTLPKIINKLEYKKLSYTFRIN